METKLRIRNRLLKSAFSLVIFVLSGCGGGSGSHNQNNQGPTAILNGSTTAAATNHWAAPNCGVQVELTADGGFLFAVTDISGTTSAGGGGWTASGNNGLTVTGAGSGLGGFTWVSSLTGISGSTSSGSFSAGVTVTDSTNTSQNLGTCSFSLQSGVIVP